MKRRKILWPLIVCWLPVVFLWEGVKAFFYCGGCAVIDTAREFDLWATDIPNRAVTRAESFFAAVPRWVWMVGALVAGVVLGAFGINLFDLAARMIGAR